LEDDAVVGELGVVAQRLHLLLGGDQLLVKAGRGRGDLATGLAEGAEELLDEVLLVLGILPDVVEGSGLEVELVLVLVGLPLSSGDDGTAVSQMSVLHSPLDVVDHETVGQLVVGGQHPRVVAVGQLARVLDGIEVVSRQNVVNLGDITAELSVAIPLNSAGGVGLG